MNSQRLRNPYTFDRALLDHHTEKVRDIDEWTKDPKPWTNFPAINRGNQGSSAERHLLYRMAFELGSGHYADIGCLFGASAACMIHGLIDGGHSGTIHLVDLFGEVIDGEQAGHPETPARLQAYINENNFASRIQLRVWKGDSADSGHLVSNTFRFVWVDGDHSYYGCSRDIAAWARHVEVGGRIGFHDTHSSGVDAALKGLPEHFKFLRQIYSSKVFERE